MAAGGRAPTDAEAAQMRAAQLELDRVDAELGDFDARIVQLEGDERRDNLAASLYAEQERRDPRGSRTAFGDGVSGEPRTYDRGTARKGTSFFRDLVNSASGDVVAAQRLVRHSQEATIEGEMPQRAGTSGGFVGMVPPAYLNELAAPVLRAGRPLANAVRQMDLPETGMSVQIPRGTTGAAVASQATENSSVQSTDEVWANLVVPVVTIAGQQDISRQTLDRGENVDQIVFEDLTGALAAEVDRQVVTGTGASNQMLGILNTIGINAATAFGAAATAGLFNTKIAGGIGAIAGTGAMVTPRAVVMHPRRWAWLCAQVDSQGRPLVVPNAGGPVNVLAANIVPGGYGGDGDNEAGLTIVGTLQGLPVITDANVPVTLGGGALEDVAIALDTQQAILLEDPNAPLLFRYEQTLGNQLTVKLVCAEYAAFTAGRYPTSISKIGGVDATSGFGLTTPTF
jgi:HK97 family phage major capsid protein